jgi:hypothetical protein
MSDIQPKLKWRTAATCPSIPAAAGGADRPRCVALEMRTVTRDVVHWLRRALHGLGQDMAEVYFDLV